MCLRRFWLPLLAAALLAGSSGVRADDKGLEAWQERILRALERREEDRRDDGDGRGRERDGARERDRAPRRQSLLAPASGDPGARAAAAEARKRFGGRVLAVGRAREGYRVRLLRENGRVTTVTIRD